MMTLILLGATLGLLGIVAGIYLTGLIHDHRIGDLSAAQYTAMHKMRDETFRRVMPVVGLTTVVLVTVCAIFLAGSGTSRILTAVAAMLLVADMALAIRRQVPLNKQIQRWTHATVPSDWMRIRDQWAARHRVRAVLGTMAYACLLIAVLLKTFETGPPRRSIQA
jgi:hypothetical protein